MPYIGKKPENIIATAVDSTTGTFSSDIDVDGITNLDVVDIDGAVDMASTLTVGGVTTLNGKFLIDGSNNDLMTFRTTGDTSSQVLGLQFQNNSEAVTAQIFGTGDNSSSGVFRIKGIGDVAIVGGDVGVTGAAGDLVVKSGGDVQVGTGNLVISTSGKGIDFSANSNLSGMSSELFDHYEEGTYTISEPSGQATITNNRVHYTKIGRLVTVQASITVGSNSNTNPLNLSLPFASSINTHYLGGGNIGYTTASSSYVNDNMRPNIENAADNVFFITTTNTALTCANLSGIRIDFAISYYTE